MTSAPLPALPLISATQVNLWDECKRKWAWRYVAKIKAPQGEGASLGTEVDDTQIQPYLRDGRPFDYTRLSGYIAAAGLAYLPQPMAPGLEIQKHFVIPSARGDFAYQGYKDIALADGSHMPLCEAGVPVVSDIKTSSDVNKWAKSEKQLAHDTQAQLYAYDTLLSTGANDVDLVWIYLQTKKTKKVKRVHLRVARPHAEAVFSEIESRAFAMVDTLNASTGSDPLEFPLSLPPNLAMCGQYGGCPYQDRCNLGPADRLESQLAKGAPDMSNAAALFAQLAAKAGMPAPAPEAVPAALMGPYVPKSAAGAAVLGVTMPPATAPQPTAPVAAVLVTSPAPLGINPPEAALPPAPPVGTAPAAEPEKPKARRGRPPKPKPEETVDGGAGFTPIAPGQTATTSSHVENHCTTVEVLAPEAAEFVEVTWGEECFSPVQYQSFRVGPFTVRSAVRPGESLEAAILRVHGELHSVAATIRGAKAASFKGAVSS